MMHPKAISCWCLFLVQSLALGSQVKVDVIGPWPEYCGSQIAEAGAWLYGKGPDKFWSFLDKLATKSTLPKGNDIVAFVEDEGLLPKDQVGLLQTSLKLRSSANLAGIYSNLLKENAGAIPKSKTCRSFIQAGNRMACTVAKAEELVKKVVAGDITGCSKESVLEGFDKVSTLYSESLPVVILWADPLNTEGYEMHKLLLERARKHELTYVYRYRIFNEGCELEDPNIHLTGFGSSFEFKGTNGGQVTTELKATISEALGDKSLNYSIEFNTELPAERLVDLGLKTTKLVASAKDPLSVLKNLVCNFAASASAIAAHPLTITDRERNELQELQKRSYMFPQLEMVSINGMLIESGGLSLPGLVDFARDYSNAYEGISDTVKYSTAEALVKGGLSKQPATFNIPSEAVVFLNDLETDKIYDSHPESLKSLLRHSNSGFYEIKRNLITAVVGLDPKSSDALGILKNIKAGWIGRAAPIRFGVFLTNSREYDDSRLLMKAFYGVQKKFGTKAALSLLEIYLQCENKDVEDVFKEMLKAEGLSVESLDEITEPEEARELYIKASELMKNFCLGTKPVLFLNGRFHQITDFDADLIQAYRIEMNELQTQIYRGNLQDSVKDLYEHLLASRRAFSHRHPLLFDFNAQAVVDLTMMNKDLSDLLFSSNQYLFPESLSTAEKETVPATIWLVVDVNKRYEIDLVKEALNFLKSTKQPCRLRLIYANPYDRDLKVALTGNRELLRHSLALDKYADFLERTIRMRQQSTEHLKKPDAKGSKLKLDDSQAYQATELVKSLLLLSGQGNKYSNPLVYLNGRLAVKLPVGAEGFKAEHFELMLQQEKKARLERYQALLPHEDIPDLMVKATVFEFKTLEALRKNLGAVSVDFHPFPEVIPPFTQVKAGKGSLVKLKAVFDPLSLFGQRLASILQSLDNAEWLSAEAYLNPLIRLAHFPLPNLYRFSYGGDNSEGLSVEEGNKFALVLDTPPAWETVPDESSSVSDPDNISSGEGTVVMKLRSLLVEARMLQPSGAKSLSGLVIVAKDQLGNVIEQAPLMGDVNVAHFSKLTNTLFTLHLEPSYEKQFETLTYPSLNYISSVGRAVQNLALKPLGPSENSYHLSRTTKSNDKTINVFSIASGAAYERLIRIMMKSVVTTTKAPVKFWLVDNFITPQFRQSVEQLSKHLGFSFEFVQMRWPTWLRPQLKKHRQVWAYKILFLDQFFKDRNVMRFIYVDADQVVRSDLSELMKIDLKEAAWGFVPFCDSRNETDGFRFWKSGYWKELLGSKPYHISALFVVDLEVFHAQGIPSRLRRDYQMLSADPGSLANLDQDLPNHLQEEHPIFSLPQEWLWCETWCDDESKSKAKSIDLCNWPGKSESKIEQGIRIIPEWQDYDQEVDQILKGNLVVKEKTDL